MKKTIAILLALIMVLGMLAGCGGSSASSNASSGTTESAPAANIALGRPEASIEEIRTAARRAGIDRLIERLPDGYDTRLGEFGSYLSGGERQRIGIARVMLMDPDVIVMDEPTSSLDVFNEKILLKTLSDEYSDKTIIIVSHRRSTLNGCDRILRLQNGSLSEVEAG